jgi:hypothetical protein
MNVTTKKVALIAATLLTTAVFSANALSAETSLTTGGYAKQMHKMELMKMLDADGNHMVTLDEFNNFNTSVFDELDTDHDGTLNAKEWVGKTIGEQPISIATGGYSRELRKMKMMGLMDADGDHKITKDEFLTHQQKIFSTMDKSNDQQLDAQEWIAKHVGGN